MERHTQSSVYQTFPNDILVLDFFISDRRGLVRVCRETGRYMQGLYHAEFYTWAAALCFRFFAQQAASVGLSERGWHDRICGTRTTSGRYCSDRAVAGTYFNLLHHKGDCCNNPAWCYWTVYHFQSIWGIKVFFNFPIEYKLWLRLSKVLVTWSLRQHVESNETPRFLGKSMLDGLRVSQMFMPICWFWMVLLLVVIMISPVLSSFSFKRLLAIYIVISLIEASRQDIAVSLDIDTPGRKYTTEHRPHKDESSTHFFRMIIPRVFT